MDAELLNILLTTFGSIVTVYVGGTGINNFKVIREYKDRKIKVFPTKIKDQCNILLSDDLQHSFKEDLDNFYNVLSSRLNPSLLANFNQNIRTLKIREEKKHNVYGAGYTPSSNTISLGILSKKPPLYHELLHLASFHREQNILHVGISQYTRGEFIGEGLNEGYTELLKKRYFGMFDKSCNIYEYAVKVDSILESVIGREIMEECYFKSDLNTLCLKLSDYIDQDEIYQLIQDTDYLVAAFKRFQSGLTFKYNLDKFNNVNRILYKLCMNKLMTMGTYNEENMKNVKDSLPKFFKANVGTYVIKTNFDKEMRKESNYER